MGVYPTHSLAIIDPPLARRCRVILYRMSFGYPYIQRITALWDAQTEDVIGEARVTFLRVKGVAEVSPERLKEFGRIHAVCATCGEHHVHDGSDPTKNIDNWADCHEFDHMGHEVKFVQEFLHGFQGFPDLRRAVSAEDVMAEDGTLSGDTE